MTAPLAEQVVRLVHRIVQPLSARLGSMMLRAVLDADAKDTTGFQVVKLKALGELLDNVEHLQPGGMTHVPSAGAEGLVLSISGRRSHSVAILVSNRKGRPKGLEPGETALYVVGGEHAGIRVHCKAGGETWIGKQTEATDHVALAGKVRAAISAMLDAGAAAGGAPGAAFGLAKTQWETPVTGGDVAATNTKAD